MTDLQFSTNAMRRPAEERQGPDGRSYLVVPGTIIVEGVLGDEFVPADEFGRHVQAWAGRPLPLGHPRDGNGFISANSPDLIERLSVGYFWNPRLEGDRVRGEYWIDIEKAQRMGGDAQLLLDRVRANQMIETSTAYFRRLEERSGNWRGKPYAGVARDIVPDHIAVLLHQRGNCSIGDGCGLLANSEGSCGCGCGSKKEEPTANESPLDAARQGVMLAFYLRPDIADQLALSPDDVPEGSNITPAGDLHVTLAYLGRIDEMRVGEIDMLGRVAELAQRLPTIRGWINGIGIFNSIQEDDTVPLWLHVDSPAIFEWRRRLVQEIEGPVTVSQRNGFTPHITLAYVPAETPISLVRPPVQELIFDAVSLSWGDRVTRFPLQGEAVANSEEGIMSEKEKGTEQQPDIATIVANAISQAVPALVTDAVAAAIQPINEQLPAITERLQGVEGLISDLGGAEQLRETLQLARSHAEAMAANAEREKTRLVQTLIANQRCAFTADELGAMGITQLSKLVQSLTTPDYSGRGASYQEMATNADEWEDLPTLADAQK